MTLTAWIGKSICLEIGMHKVEAHGASIPAIGFGTWTLKGSTCSELTKSALDVGYRHLDTAAMYENEVEVGEGLRLSGVGRDEVFITTKVWYTDIGDGNLQNSAQSSLRKLGLDEVDLLLIHWPNPEIPLAESIGALNEVRARGLTRHIGVSNFPTGTLAEAIGLSDAPLVCNQVEYHPYLNQQKVLGACRSNGMAMVSYCPLARGGNLFAEKAVIDAAYRHGKTPAQVILRWHVQQSDVIAIPRTSKVDRLRENGAVFDFELSSEEMSAISSLSAANERICDYGFSPAWDD